MKNLSLMLLELRTQLESPLHAIRNIAPRFFTYATVGAIAAGCYYSLLIFQVEALHIHPLAASVASFIGGGLTSFGLNSTITFGDRRRTSWPLAKFLIISTVGLGLNAFFMVTIMSIFQVHYLIAQAAATAVVLVWNFSGNFLWTFGGTSAD
jgi:putative flippase GtrA